MQNELKRAQPLSGWARFNNPVVISSVELYRLSLVLTLLQRSSLYHGRDYPL